MRRLIYPAVLLLLAAGCRSTDSIEQLQSGRRSDCDVVTILAPSNNELTRTTLQNDNGTYNIYWTRGDKIGVYSEWTDNAEFTLNTIEQQEEVAFQGTIAGAPEYAYYPYSGEAGADPGSITMNLPATQQQTGNDNPNMAYDLKAGQRNGGSAASGYTFTFQQKLTLLRFTLTPDASLDGDQLLSIKLTAPEGSKLAGDFTLDITSDVKAPVFSEQNFSNEVTVSFVGSTVSLEKNKPVVGYVFINPDIKQGDNLVITVNTNRHIVTTTSATAGEAFQLGALYDISMDINSLGRDVKVEIAQKVLWTAATTPGYYSISSDGLATSIHLYEACKDQYTYSTSGGYYSFTIQSMKKGKLSRLTVIKDEIKNGSTSTNLSATLYTIHGSEGAVAEPGTWTIVKKEDNKYWLKNSDHTKGFILLVEED